jgi:glucose-1-phosphate cytidylyltransferase
MKMYSRHGINDFIVCLGYKGYVIKEYFSNYFLHTSDVTFRMNSNAMEIHEQYAEPWNVTLVDTGEKTMTGGRLKRVAKFLKPGTFCFTYGDGVSDIDISKLLAFHKSGGKRATVTAIQPPGRYGALEIADDRVVKFQEKPAGDGSWINGGFFVLETSVLGDITDDSTVWEQEPLQRLAAEGQLSAYRHHGFWQAMDTMRDKLHLEELLATNKAPWKTW